MHELKTALRSLLSSPVPTVVVIATLAIAIGANTAIFSVVEGVLLQPFGYGDDGRLVVLWAANESDESERFRLSPADYRDVRDGAATFDGRVVLYRFIGSTLTGLDEPVRVGSLTVTPRVFAVLEARPAVGRFFSDEDEKPGGGRKVVLTYASWTRRFGSDPSIVGTAIEIDGEPATVLGVAGEGFRFPPGNADVEMYFPMALSDAVLLDRNHRMFDAIARLAGDASLPDAQAELSVMSERLAREFPDSNAGWRLTARPLRDELLGELSTTLAVLSGAVFLVLLTACANVANVLVARSTSVSREFAVRAVLGARSGHLMKRSLAEASILGLCGAALGLLLAYWGVGLLRTLLPADIPRVDAVGLDGSVLAFAIAIAIGATILFGSIPALRSMAPDVADLLKPALSYGSAPRAGRRLREAMVVVEVALALVLLVGAGLMVRSFHRLSDVDPGFRRDGVVSVAVALPRSRHDRTEWKSFFETLVERVDELPGVVRAGAVSDLPMHDVGLGLELEFTVPGLDAVSPTARPNADVRLVIPGYFEAMGIRVVRGRDFDRLDASGDRRVALVNETLVERYFQSIDPIGRPISLAMLGDVEVVGVVADVHHESLASKYESEVYLPYGRPATGEMHVVVHSTLDTAAVAMGVGAVLKDMDSQLAPSRAAAVADLLWESTARPRFNAALLGGLALASALLAVVGTYGIVAYSVSQRRGEIGLRMALGADSTATLLLVLRQALGIVVTGALLGTLGALGATRFLRGLLFEVEPTDPATYGVVLLAAMVVGGLAAWFSARRATRVDPLVALRSE